MEYNAKYAKVSYYQWVAPCPLRYDFMLLTFKNNPGESWFVVVMDT